MDAQQEIESLRTELQQADKDLAQKRERLNNLLTTEHDATVAKAQRAMKGIDKFDPSELIFAADSRCPCGAGLAYPKRIGPWGSWYCSAILAGCASAEKEHTQPLPFNMYEVKSENQPSANGATTRPS